MQRRHRPVPISIPPETALAYELTEQGTYMEGGLTIGKSGTTFDISCGATKRGASANATSRSGCVLRQCSLDDPPCTSNRVGDVRLSDLLEIDVVGSGSSGVVKKVKHKPTGNTYVLKYIHFDIQSDVLRKQIAVELRTLYGAHHPHIVNYHESFMQEGSIAILIEYMDRGSLAAVLTQVKKIPERYLAEIARHILRGLQYLHKELKVVHRDIKPSNLLLNSQGVLKITDFGVSGQLTNSVSHCVSWVGTVTYMAPERIKGEAYSFGSDIWSVGLTLVECALGRFPYPPPGDQVQQLGFWELLEYIVVEPVPQLPKEHFTTEFREFVRACLQKDPAARASAAELLQHPWLKKQRPLKLSGLTDPQKKSST